MSLRAKNGRWEYRFAINGERVTRLTDLAATPQNEAAARRLEVKHRDSILKGEQPAKRMEARPFNRAVEEFVQHANVTYAEHPNTAKRIATSLASAKEFFGTKATTALRARDIERYKVHRLTVHQVQPITVRHDLNALSLFFQWGADMEMLAANLISRKSYKGLPSEAERIHVITPAEEFVYFEAAAAHPNLADVARLMLEQGCRPDEVMSLERAHWTGTHIRIAHGKTAAAKRRLKLTTQSRMILERRAAEYPGSRWFFPSLRRRGEHLVKLNGVHDEVCRKTGLAFVLYDWRHTFATRAAQAGMDLATLAKILGHSSLRMVMKYVHPTQEHQDAEMERLERQRPVATARPGDLEGKGGVQ